MHSTPAFVCSEPGSPTPHIRHDVEIAIHQYIMGLAWVFCHRWIRTSFLNTHGRGNYSPFATRIRCDAFRRDSLTSPLTHTHEMVSSQSRRSCMRFLCLVDVIEGLGRVYPMHGCFFRLRDLRLCVLAYVLFYFIYFCPSRFVAANVVDASYG